VSLLEYVVTVIANNIHPSAAPRAKTAYTWHPAHCLFSGKCRSEPFMLQHYSGPSVLGTKNKNGRPVSAADKSERKSTASISESALQSSGQIYEGRADCISHLGFRLRRDLLCKQHTILSSWPLVLNFSSETRNRNNLNPCKLWLLELHWLDILSFSSPSPTSASPPISCCDIDPFETPCLDRHAHFSRKANP
jgi:hypothetical protein